jgi:WhiB family redox-sensing transcriptional regulator
VKTGDWRNRAACVAHEPELFFPIGTTGPAGAHLADAQKVCQGCEVRNDCLEWLAEGIDHGVWGGYSEDQRRLLRRRAARNRNTSISPR